MKLFRRMFGQHDKPISEKSSKQSNGDPEWIQLAKRRLIHPEWITSIIAVVARGTADPPMERLAFALRVFETTNPKMFAALKRMKRFSRITVGYHASTKMDSTTGHMPHEHWTTVLEEFETPSNYSVCIQSMIVNVEPKHVLIFTVLRTDEAVNLFIAGEIEPTP